jgi:hypothetical protein
MQAPLGLPGIKAIFGDITVVNHQVVAPFHWESNSMLLAVDLPLVVHKLYVNRLIEPALRQALAACEALNDGYQLRTIGCFNPRPKRVNGDLSTHSWGIAVDLNADTNPIADAAGDAPTCDLPTAWIAAFKDSGFTWGGEFRRPDPMHFQFCSGY